MYLWIFFKFPALKLSHQEAGLGTELPFGTIFAALMCAMMLGSLFFTYYSSLVESRWVGKPSTLLMITLSVASICFMVPVLTHNEALTFWCFCIFEVACGIYFPSMAHLKEKIVDDGVRAKIYGIMRVPLNLFVVVGLMLTKDGKHSEQYLESSDSYPARVATPRERFPFLQRRIDHSCCSFGFAHP